ncbi:rhomboid family intramembrane serine protease [Candidatus Microgenomates bacterium]|nr:MAG: rhomboid family intramembrane serine protease [Candidatus Microgenomates bacterium]
MFPLKDHHPSYKFPIVTVIIIALNILFWLVELATADLESFVNTWALVPASVNFLQTNTLVPFVTSMFLHGGWLHIISNMWFLWIFGDNIEATLGSFKFVIYYLICGIAAGLLQYVIDPSSAIPMLGASGAIAGVLGGYLVLFPRAQIESLLTFGFFWQRINVPASLMLGYWFITQLFSGVGSVAVATGAEGGTAFFAHIGGFATGWLIATLLIKPTISWQRID